MSEADGSQDATIDREAVVCDGAGVFDLERLNSREHDRRAFLDAFDLLELDGVDLRPLRIVVGHTRQKRCVYAVEIL